MTIVQTVNGPISPEDLGTTGCHQHLLIAPPPEWRPDPDYAITDVAKVTEDVVAFKDAGGRALIEMTAVGQRRDLQDIRRISSETGVHVIITTGFSQEPPMPALPREQPIEAIVEFMQKEIIEGIDDLDIKAGLVKAGSSFDRISPPEEKVFRAAVRTQKKTGAAISTHTTGGTAALLQVELFQSEGADLSRIAIGHLDRYLHYGYLRMIARTGANLLFDGIGKTKYSPDSLRAEMVCRLLEEGFIEQLFLGFDNGRRSYFPSYGGGPGQAHLIEEFLPRLQEMGVSAEEIHQITVLNPARLFTVG